MNEVIIDTRIFDEAAKSKAREDRKTVAFAGLVIMTVVFPAAVLVEAARDERVQKRARDLVVKTGQAAADLANVVYTTALAAGGTVAWLFRGRNEEEALAASDPDDDDTSEDYATERVLDEDPEGPTVN